MYGDYRPANRKTNLDIYPMPMFEKLFDVLRRTKIFLGLRLGYHQLPLRLEDRSIIAIWGSENHWKFLPFGLKNAST